MMATLNHRGARDLSPEPAPLPLPNISENLLFEILEYLTLTDRRKTIASCRTLWKKRRSLENCVKRLQIRSNKEVQGALLTRHLLMDRYGPVLSNLTSLLHLDVGCHGTDGLLYLLPTSACCSTLKSLSMVGSQGVTDNGLMMMTRRNPAVTDIPTHETPNDRLSHPPHRSSPLIALEYIDLTFCRKTTYEGTMWLRDGLPNLRCIRRLPSWMEGRFHTPFGPQDGSEIHTYWSDGTFSFTRDSQSSGYVMDLFPCDKLNFGRNDGVDQEGDEYDFSAVDFVGDKLQYNPVGFGENVPQILQYTYRPGVSLFRLPPEQGSDSATSQVLVAQHVNGLKPPAIRNWMEQAAGDNIPVGQTKYYGLRVSTEGAGDQWGLVETQSDREYEENPTGPRPIVMMTKMRVEPLYANATFSSSEGSGSGVVEYPLPPPSLVESCRATCRKLHQYDHGFLRHMERELDDYLQRSGRRQNG